MVMSAAVRHEAGCLHVQGDLVMDNASVLLAEGSRFLAESQNIRIANLAGVTQADSSGLAVLLEWQRQVQESGAQLRLENLPSGLIALADLYDLDTFVAQA